MASDEEKDLLKLMMHVMRRHTASIENWKYVLQNAEYLEKKKVTEALEQVLLEYEPMIKVLQEFFELEALTTLDPHDLI